MGIFGKNKYDVNFISLPQQVSKNKIDIENLQKIIKQAYKTTTQLTEQSVSVALNTTNITDTTIKSGWLMDPNGLLFQIASVLEDLVYINFWANLKGETGQNGKDGIQGVPGKNGNRIFVLPDEQLPSNYNEYDLLLNIPSYELLEYSKILETDPEPTWHSIGNLEGPKGSTGPQGPVGPQGPQGPIGPQGPAGDVTATQLHELIQGSDTVVADLTEDGQHIEIHLDNNITTEIHNGLQKPATTPSATQIVAVDNTNTQTMLNIGDGLSVENGSLKASGGTGEKKYFHQIALYKASDDLLFYFNLVTTTPKFTNDTEVINEIPNNLYISCVPVLENGTLTNLPILAVKESNYITITSVDFTTKAITSNSLSGPFELLYDNSVEL